MIGRFNPAGLLAGRPDVQKQAMMAQQQPPRQGLLGQARSAIGGLLGGIGNQIERGQTEDEGFNLFRFRPPEGMNQSDMIAMGTAGLMDAFVPQMGGNRLAMQSQMTGQRIEGRQQALAQQQQQEQMDAFRATLPAEQQALFDMNPEGFLTQMTEAAFAPAETPTGFAGQLVAAGIDPQSEEGQLYMRDYARRQTEPTAPLVSIQQPGMFFDLDAQGNPRIVMGDADTIDSGIGASTRDRLQEQQVTMINAAEDILGRIDLLEGAVAEAGPGSSGWVLRLRELGTGALNNLEEIASYGPEGQRFAQTANAIISDARNKSDLNESTLRQFFSNEVSGVDLATNLLAYDMAKAVSPDNRVTDLDFRNMRQSLGQLSDAQRAVALRTLRQDTTDRAERARRRLRDFQPDSPQAGASPEAVEPRGLLTNQPQRPDEGQIARPTTQQEFDALPVGALYIDPDDGRTYRKTGGQ